jgi:uncharacterized repeat protein (TIGR01451 family)
MKRILAAIWVLMFTLLLSAPARATCNGGACVMAGPRLASVSTSQGALTNALMGGLLGTSVNLSVLDWNSIATGDISAVSFINALQTQLGVATPAQALSANATLAQLVSAAAAAAQADGLTATASALNALYIPVSGLSGTIPVANLLSIGLPTGSLTDVKLNALNLVTGFVQAFNYANVLATPSPITVSGASLGLGSAIGSIKLYAQVVEPPTIVCGPVSTSFHSAAIRVKLDMTLVSQALDASSLIGLGAVTSAGVSLSHIELYLDIARADGTITVVDAIAKAVTINATPGVADVYLGTIADAVFWNRTHAINANTDLSYSKVGALTLTVVLVGTLNVDINVKSFAHGQAPFTTGLSFNGPYPQTKTASTSAVFVNNLVSGLTTNLQLSVNPSLGALLDGLVLAPLKTIVATGLSPQLFNALSNVADPLLELIGVKLGQVEVTVFGTALTCSVSGAVYNDANHNAHADGFEAGTGVTLYAKLIASTSPTGPALQAVAVNTTSGSYNFDNVWPASYVVLVDTNNTLSDVTPGVTSGWIPTETPTLSRNDVTLSTGDISGKNFGVFNGSKLSGTVFKDSGTGAGTANNGTQDGTESGLGGVAVQVTNNAGNASYDNTTTGGDGTYTLWIAATAGNVTLKVVETNLAGYVSTAGGAGTTAGTYARATDTLTFTNAIGTTYTGVTFADVPVNKLELDGQRAARPGTVVLFPHTFTAGSGGTVSFAIDNSTNPNAADWTQVIYQDTDCNGAINGSETVLGATTTLVADQKLCILVKTAVPTNAAYSKRSLATLTATFTYTNASPALNAPLSLTETVTVGQTDDSVLKLSKTVDKASAKGGDVITYEIAYTNQGDKPLQSLKINDATPAYTLFSSGACGTLATGLTNCTMTKAPAAGAAGALEWTFTGALTPGASGKVTFAVTLQ